MLDKKLKQILIHVFAIGHVNTWRQTIDFRLLSSDIDILFQVNFAKRLCRCCYFNNKLKCTVSMMKRTLKRIKPTIFTTNNIIICFDELKKIKTKKKRFPSLKRMWPTKHFMINLIV